MVVTEKFRSLHIYGLQEREGEKTERDKKLAIRVFRFRVLPCLREIELPGRDIESRERKPSSKRRISVENDGFTYLIIIWLANSIVDSSSPSAIVINSVE